MRKIHPRSPRLQSTQFPKLRPVVRSHARKHLGETGCILLMKTRHCGPHRFPASRRKRQDHQEARPLFQKRQHGRAASGPTAPPPCRSPNDRMARQGQHGPAVLLCSVRPAACARELCLPRVSFVFRVSDTPPGRKGAPTTGPREACYTGSWRRESAPPERGRCVARGLCLRRTTICAAGPAPSSLRESARTSRGKGACGNAHDGSNRSSAPTSPCTRRSGPEFPFSEVRSA